jgi:hypothetical protein
VLPFAFVAVIRYTVVVAGVTTTDPEEVADWLPSPWLIATVFASVVAHESVLEAPGIMYAGEAMKEDIAGRILLGVTPFEGDEAAETPAAFVAVTVKVYVWPFTRPGTTTGLPVELAAMLPGLEVAV